MPTNQQVIKFISTHGISLLLVFAVSYIGGNFITNLYESTQEFPQENVEVMEFPNWGDKMEFEGATYIVTDVRKYPWGEVEVEMTKEN